MKLRQKRKQSQTPFSHTVEEQSPAGSSVAGAVTKGALWMIFARLADRSLGVVSTLILVRLLSPADFGLVAMGMSIIAVCELFGQMGLDVALIQNPNAARRHYDTAWTFGVMNSIVTAVILVLLVVPAASFYNEPRLLPIVFALAVGAIISGFENIGVVAFRKELHFNKEFLFVFAKKLAGFVVTVPLAFMLRSYWALVSGIVVGRLASVCLSYYVQEYRPRFSFAARRELFHFSKWMVICNFVNAANSRGADFIIGKIAGAHALGVFNVSYELSNLPTSELIAPINRAVFPGYARKSTDAAELRQGYLSVIGIIAAFGAPAGVGIAATADVIVPLVFGQQWTEAVPLVAILALYGVIAAMKTNAHYIYLALGRPKVAAGLGVVQITLLLPSLIFLCMRYGVVGAAWAYLVSQAVFTPLSFWTLFKILDVKLGQLLQVLWRPVVAATFMFALVRFVLPSSPFEAINSSSALAHLIRAVITGAAAYISSLYGLWLLSARPVGAESWILGVVQSTTFRLQGKVATAFGR